MTLSIQKRYRNNKTARAHTHTHTHTPHTTHTHTHTHTAAIATASASAAAAATDSSARVNVKDAKDTHPSVPATAFLLCNCAPKACQGTVDLHIDLQIDMHIDLHIDLHAHCHTPKACQGSHEHPPARALALHLMQCRGKCSNTCSWFNLACSLDVL